MDSGYYAILTGLVARTQQLDIAAHNVANAGTSGYRAQREFFEGLTAAAHAADSQVGQAVNRYGVLGGDRPDLTQGQLSQTGRPLDLAVEGGGFFAVQTRAGTRYTRDGSFRTQQDGLLTTGDGLPVLDTSGKEIRLPSGEVSVSADGTISVAGALAGRLGLFTPSSGSTLAPEGTNRYAATGGMTASSGSTVHQGMLEGSNQSAIEGAVELVSLQRQAEMMQRSLQLFHSEFNRIAAEDLPRV